MRRTVVIGLVAIALIAGIAFLLLRDRCSNAGDVGEGDRGSFGGARGAAPAAPTMDDSYGRQYRYSAGSRSVAGRVLEDTTEEPVPYVDVTFKRGRPESTATSDEDGRYSIDLAPGTYSVSAIGDDVLALAQPPLRVGSVQGTIAFDVRVVRLATARGKVVYSDGSPAAGAEVKVRADSTAVKVYLKTGQLPPTEADASGEFELRVPPGDVELRAIVGDVHGFARLESVAPGSSREGVEIVLAANATIIGAVRDPEGRGIAGAEVYASVKRPRATKYETTKTVADDGGRFEFRVRAGFTIVEAVADGYGRDSFDTTPGERRELVVTMQGPARITGRVVDVHGDPVAGAEVARNRRMSKIGPHKVTTDADGAFEFTNLDRGPHRLTASHEDRGTAATSEAIDAPATGVVLQLIPHGGVRGQVTAGGMPAKQFVVRLVKSGSSVPSVADTRFAADDGRYELFPVGPGRYDVIVSAPGHAAARKRIEVPPSGWGDGSMVLRVGGTIRGTVTSKATGRAVARARVTLPSADGGKTAFTGSDGEFVLAHVAPGKRSITVAHGQYERLESGEIEVRDAEETAVSLTLSPK